MDILAFVLTILGLFLAGRKSMYCWPVWIGSNIIWIAYFIPKSEWAAITTNACLFCMNVYGWYNWKKDLTK